MLTTSTRRSQAYSVDAASWCRPIVLHAALGVIVVCVGLFGTLAHSGIRTHVASSIDIHGLFGALLFALVVARLHWSLRYAAPAGPADLRELTRHLSRVVYLVLYLVIGAAQVVNIVNYFIFNEAACSPPGCMNPGATADLRVIFAYGIAVLIAIRLLIHWLSRTDACGSSSGHT